MFYDAILFPRVDTLTITTSVCMCVYKISLETVDFLIQINPVCSCCKVVCVCMCLCVCGWQCFVGIEQTGGPDIFCSLRRSMLTLDLFTYEFSLEESPSREMVKY